MYWLKWQIGASTEDAEMGGRGGGTFAEFRPRDPETLAVPRQINSP
jgi:hypothetical protein